MDSFPASFNSALHKSTIPEERVRQLRKRIYEECRFSTGCSFRWVNEIPVSELQQLQLELAGLSWRMWWRGGESYIFIAVEPALE